MPTYIKTGFWEKTKKGYREWLNLDQFIDSRIPAPTYKVYTALLTQSGGDGQESISSGTLTIGVTYFIDEVFDNSGADLINVGAPNNNVGTYFVATGTIPNSWGEVGSETTLIYNTGAPVVTVLENTIGNIWFTYNVLGEYQINSNDLFTIDKSWGICPANSGQGNTNLFNLLNVNSIELVTSNSSDILEDNLLFNTPIEIRVYN